MERYRSNRRPLNSAALACAFAATALACGGDEALRLDEGGLEPAYAETERRMDLTVTLNMLDGTSATAPLPPAYLANYIGPHCARLVADSRCTAASPTACQTLGCQVDRFECQVQTVLEIIESPAPTTLTGAFSPQTIREVVVSAPDAPSRAALARLAADWTQFMGGYAGQAVTTGQCTTAELDAQQGTSGALSTGQYFATQYGHALELLEQAEHHLVAASRDAAQDQMSRQADSALAAHLALLDPSVSRSVAAHALLGGANGLPGMGSAPGSVGSDGFCAVAPLDAEGERALELLRLAAPPPSAILAVAAGADTTSLVDTSELVLGWSGHAAPVPATDPGLRARLRLLQSDSRLASTSLTYQQVLSILGVSEDGLVAARAYLGREILALHRSRTQTIPNSYGLTLYAGTRMPPRRPVTGFYSAVSRYRTATSFSVPAAGSAGYTEAQPPLFVATGSPISSMYEAALTSVRRVSALSTVAVDVRNVLGALTAESVARYPERVDFVYESDLATGISGDQLYVRIHRLANAPAATYEVIAGLDALSCAVTGTIEGVPCTIPGSVVAGSWPTQPSTWTNTTAPANLVTGFASSLTGRVAVPELVSATAGASSPIADAMLVFVVRRTISTRRPGAYTLVTGALLPTLPSTLRSATQAAQYRLDIPVIPELEVEVDALMTPSPEDCMQADETCTGLPRDLRIPLENELLTDGVDGVEDSWRFFLGQARQAAASADQLGEELIRAGMDMDQRSEQAIDELEQACGAAINISSIGQVGTAPTRVVTPIGTACQQGYVRNGGDCVISIAEMAVASAASSADAERLRECLGTDGTVAHAALGDTPLCFWQSTGQPDTLCQGETSQYPCPFAMSATGTCPTSQMPNNGAGLEAIPVATTLDLFALPPPEELNPPPLDRTEYPCAALARFRAGTGSIDNVRGPFWSAEYFAQLASRIGWAPVAGDYSRLTLDNTELFSTGNPITGPDADWPCGISAPTSPVGDGALCAHVAITDPSQAIARADSDTDTSFFCHRSVCGARESRARMNDLFARAAIAARLLGGASLAGLQMPYSPRTPGDQWLTLVYPQTWTTPRDAFGGASYSRSQEGTLFFHSTGGGDWDQTSIGWSDLSAFAERLTGGVEWTRCPHDRAVCAETYDDADHAVVDGGAIENRLTDHGLPFMVRTLPSEMEGADSATLAHVLWGGDSTAAGYDEYRGLVDTLADRRVRPTARVLHGYDGFGAYDPRSGDEPISALTNYWRRIDCGATGCANRFEVNRQSVECYSDTQSGCTSLGCRGRYFGCDRFADGEGIDFHSTIDGNRAFIAGPGLTRADMLNGMELLCYAGQVANPDTNFGCSGAPPTITTIADALRADTFLQCKANGIRASAAQIVVRDLPAAVVEIVRGSGERAIGGGQGEYAAATEDLAAAYIELRDQELAMANAVDRMSTEIRSLRLAVASSQYAREIEELQFQSSVWNQVTSCVVAVANAASGSIAKFGISAGLDATSAAATCANMGRQISISRSIADRRGLMIEAETQQAFTRFEAQFSEINTQLSQASTRLSASYSRISAAQVRIRNLQQTARRAAARAMFLDRGETGRTFGLNTVMRRRYSTALTRYREAHERARRLAYIARIALEQRLGMSLNDLTADMVSVEAPARWAESICDLPSIDYDELRTADGEADPLDAPEGFSGAYVGDYVARLEQVFLSYSFAYPFAPGTATTVLSVRDDLHGVRAMCPAEVPNLLYQSGHLDQMASDSRPGWELEGCNLYATWPPTSPPAAGVTAPPPPNCVAVDELPDSPLPVAAGDLGRVPGYRITWGNEGALKWSDGTPMTVAGEPVDGTQDDAALVQYVDVPRGRYRLSWYVREVPGSDIETSDVVWAGLADGSFSYDPIPGLEWYTDNVTLPGGWVRYYYFFDVPTEATLAVAIHRGGAASNDVYAQVDVAGLMLEDVTDSVVGAVTAMVSTTSGAGTLQLGQLRNPRPYFDTGAERTRMLPVCEDTYGDAFRAQSWTYGCARVCPDGYDGSCRDEDAIHRCYWQTELPLNADVLQRPEITGGAGFAAGNFNYRIESIGVNFVGTGLRDCEAVGGGASCYGSGTLSYSLLHHGPFLVRGATGAPYSAPLFPGRIESASGLAYERYLSNPISSTDRALIEPFTQRELQGRPLHGTFLLRIWDDPTLRFDRLEDVQIVLGYRYWQHQR